MRTLDKVYGICRSESRPFPNELLVSNDELVLFTSPTLFGVVVGVCQDASNVDSPFRCWLQTDNTVKEVRNGFVARLATTLVQGSTFSCMSHHHLVVGHTHEDVDAVFSLVTSALSATATLMTPRDVEVAITRKLEPLFEKNGMKFEIEYVQTELWLKSYFCFSSKVCSYVMIIIYLLPGIAFNLGTGLA